MRRALWGYHVEETNDMIDSLQSQIELLTARVTNLNTELAEKNSQIREAKLNPEDSGELEALRSESERLRVENQRLKEALSKKEEAYTKEKSEAEQAGEICKQAYGDMEAMKLRVAAEMEAYVRMFNDYTAETDLKLRQVVEDLQEAKARAHEIFLISAESILENYEAMEQENEKFYGELEALNEQRQTAVREIEKLMAAFTEGQESVTAEKEGHAEEVSAADRGTSSRLARALSKKEKAEDDTSAGGAKREKKLSSLSNGNARIIGVNTHVKKNDIFGESTKSS